MSSIPHSLAFGMPGLPELIIIVLILGLSGLWIWSLVHCCVNKRLTDTNRIIAIVLIVLLHVIGSLIYLFIPRVEPGKS